jgi:hypothetical protein
MYIRVFCLTLQPAANRAKGRQKLSKVSALAYVQQKVFIENAGYPDSSGLVSGSYLN